MKFNVKSAGQYSNVLSEMIKKFGIRGYDVEREGLVKVTEIAQKSKIVTGKPELTFQDEEKENRPLDKIAQVNPMVRAQILKDLVEEKNRIDYEISRQKQSLTIQSPFTDKEINVDLATKENSLYRYFLMENYKNLLAVNDDEVETTKRMNLSIDGQNMTFEYPIVIKKESLVDDGKVNEEYTDLYSKAQTSSDLIDKALSSVSFEFDAKFPLYENVDKVIKMYKN